MMKLRIKHSPEKLSEDLLSPFVGISGGIERNSWRLFSARHIVIFALLFIAETGKGSVDLLESFSSVRSFVLIWM
jgi:hypothetical protein